MNKTNIEWVENPDGTQGYTWNPITGCLNGCEYCYARRLANGRLKQRYLANINYAPVTPIIPKLYEHLVDAWNDPFYPRFWEEKLTDPYNKTTRWGSRRRYTQKSKGIFVCDMSDLFSIGIPEEWTQRVLDTIRTCPQHRYYLLTKQPQNLIKFPSFPDNCWVGVTATGYDAFNKALDGLKVIEAKVKFISIEPLLEAIPFYMERLAYCSINWLILGSMTGTKKDIEEMHKLYPQLTPMPWGKRWTLQPQISWVEEIVRAADKAGIPVFQKDNLKPLLGDNLRQELPK